MEKPIKIGIIGPESTGKSSLARELAIHYNSDFVPEFAREYLTKLERKYTINDIRFIAEKQVQQEVLAEKNAAGKFLFCDTTLITIKIWLDVVFNESPEDFLDWMKIHEKYNHYLLTDIDMPWEPDPLREHPQFRKELFQMNKEELSLIKAEYAIISGLGRMRLSNAISAINNKFNL